jgi:hypothetical protein
MLGNQTSRWPNSRIASHADSADTLIFFVIVSLVSTTRLSPDDNAQRCCGAPLYARAWACDVYPATH